MQFVFMISMIYNKGHSIINKKILSNCFAEDFYFVFE